MRIVVFGIAGRPDLRGWKSRPVAAGVGEGPRHGDARDCHERDVGIESPGPPAADGPFRRVAAAIMSYRIFPVSLLEGICERTPVAAGDTVGALYHAFPGLKIFFASRVLHTFDEARDGHHRTGFRYQTITGHPELGEETFEVDKALDTGRIVARLESWSRPGHWISRLLHGFARRRQLAGGRAALSELARVAAGDAS